MNHPLTTIGLIAAGAVIGIVILRLTRRSRAHGGHIPRHKPNPGEHWGFIHPGEHFPNDRDLP